MTGLLTDVAIFNSALTVAETQSIYNLGNSAAVSSAADTGARRAIRWAT